MFTASIYEEDGRDGLSNMCQTSLDAMERDETLIKAKMSYNTTTIYDCSQKEYDRQTRDGKEKDVYIKCEAPEEYTKTCEKASGYGCSFSFSYRIPTTYLVETLMTVCLPSKCLDYHEDYVTMEKLLDKAMSNFCHPQSGCTECKAHLQCNNGPSRFSKTTLIIGGVVVLFIILGFLALGIIMYRKRNDPEVVNLLNAVRNNPFRRNANRNDNDENSPNVEMGVIQSDESHAAPLLLHN